jgi:hypothetical protein
VTLARYLSPAPVSQPFAAVAERAMARLWTGCASKGDIQRRSAKHDLTLPAYIGQLSCNDIIIGRGLTAHAIGEVWRHGGRPLMIKVPDSQVTPSRHAETAKDRRRPSRIDSVSPALIPLSRTPQRGRLRVILLPSISSNRCCLWQKSMRLDITNFMMRQAASLASRQHAGQEISCPTRLVVGFGH